MASSPHHVVGRPRGDGRPKALTLVAGLALSVAATAAVADDHASEAQVRAWASACLTCHSAPQGKETNAIPSLYGKSANDIQNAMRAYASGEKPGLLMQQLAKGYDEDTMRQIALWFQNASKE